MLTALAEETAAVSLACGGPSDPAQALARCDSFPPAARSSMRRDAEAGRPLELDAIGNALLRAAERHGGDVPVATRVVREPASGLHPADVGILRGSNRKELASQNRTGVPLPRGDDL